MVKVEATAEMMGNGRGCGYQTAWRLSTLRVAAAAAAACMMMMMTGQPPSSTSPPTVVTSRRFLM